MKLVCCLLCNTPYLKAFTLLSSPRFRLPARSLGAVLHLLTMLFKPLRTTRVSSGNHIIIVFLEGKHQQALKAKTQLLKVWHEHNLVTVCVMKY